MLKYFLFAVVAANLVVFAVSTCTTDADENSVIAQSVRSWLEENGCSDEDTQELITKVAEAYTSLTMQRVFQIGMMHPTSNKPTSLVPVIKASYMAAMVETGDLQAASLALTHLQSVDQIYTVMPYIEQMVNHESESSTFKVCMNVFGDCNAPFSKTFTTQNLDVCNVTSSSVDYTNRTEAAALMNDYVQSVTAYETTPIISERAFTSNPGAVVLGSSLSKVQWSPNSTVKDAGNMDFNIIGFNGYTNTASVPSLMYTGPVTVGSYEDATIYTISMAGGSCELVILTHDKGGYPFLSLIYEIADTKIFNKVMFKGDTQQATLRVPDITHATTTEHFGASLKTANLLRGVLVPNDCNVCNGLFDGSTNCSYMQTMAQTIEWIIESPCASERRRRDTTDDETDTTDTDTEVDASDASCTTPEYTIDKAFLCMIMSPLKVPHFAYLYMGNE